MILCAENYRLDDNLTFARASNYGNGSTEGICSSIFPLSSSSSLLLVSSSPDDDGGQSTDEKAWRSHSIDPCTSIPDTIAIDPSNTRNEPEIHLDDDNGDLIYSINRTSKLSIFDLPISNLSDLYRTISHNMNQVLVYKKFAR